jgi:rubrerythrin
MIATARSEGNKGAKMTFNYANEVEKIHATLYEKSLDELGRNVEADYYACHVCGYTVRG